MPMMGGLGPFSVDAERGTIADVLYPRVAQRRCATLLKVHGEMCVAGGHRPLLHPKPF